MVAKKSLSLRAVGGKPVSTEVGGGTSLLLPGSSLERPGLEEVERQPDMEVGKQVVQSDTV